MVAKKMSCSIDFNGYKYVAMVGYSTDISYASTIDLYKVENIEDNLERFIDITGIRVKVMATFFFDANGVQIIKGLGNFDESRVAYTTTVKMTSSLLSYLPVKI